MAARTFLELCQRTRELAGISGNGPISTLNQTGENLRVVNWTRQAWVDIQNRNATWAFLRKEFSFQTVPGQQVYTPAQAGMADVRELSETDTVRCFLTSVGVGDEQYMVPWGWPVFKDTYMYGLQVPARPVVFSVRPEDKAIALGAIPDQVYTVKGVYYARAAKLVAPSDVPTIPEQYDEIIPYRAIMKYAGYEAAPEVKAEARENYSQLMAALVHDQLPPITPGEPLA